MAAMEIFRAGRYEQAVGAFAAVEAECRYDTVTNIRALAKSRRAVALWELGRYGEAAALLDELAADKEALAKIVRASPHTDEVATIYRNRIVFHEELGHWPKVHACVADLIDEVGTGATPTQRKYVAMAYMSQAQAAIAERRYRAAAAALDAATAQSATAPQDRTMLALRREARERKRALPKVRSASE